MKSKTKTSLKSYLYNFPSFRKDQILRGIFLNFADNWKDISTLPQSMQKELRQNFPLQLPVKYRHSKNRKTTKALITLSDTNRIETVLMKSKKRNTICVSSQVGCPMKCSFCATGKMGFTRNLTDWEIVYQVLAFARLLASKQKKVTNVVFMGMGEPFLNFTNFKSAIGILNDENSLNIGARKISISTIGIPEGIKKLANEEIQVNLAISLHAPTNKLRTKLIPANARFPIEDILESAEYYIERKNRKVMFEYLMLKGINDSTDHAEKLAKLLSNPLFIINLIPYNPTDMKDYKPSDQKQINKFRKVLEDNNKEVTQRYEFGRDIDAACGQLATSG